MSGTVSVFVAVFAAGVASLQMELSLLREAGFVLGGTAFTNSYIISIFLGGLAAGAYLGNYAVRVIGGHARVVFCVSQAVSIVWILGFVFTKNEILYGHYDRWQTLVYFAVATLGPALVAGMSFSLFVHILYGRGERFIAWIYAVSTVGNVLSGFLHGIVLIPIFGMAATYTIACLGSGLAILLIAPAGVPTRVVATALVLLSSSAVLLAPAYPSDARHPILWSKDDIHGLVQVVDRSDDWEGYDEKPAIDLRIDNRHQCATSKRDVAWQRSGVDNAMRLLGKRAERVLNAGYCGGTSVARLLEYPSVKEVISVDMNPSVIEAASLYFSDFHEKNLADPRASIVIGEFRSYLNRLPPGEKFDVVMLDIAVLDPYAKGLFTREFFAKMNEHLSQPGVVFWYHDRELRTAASVFPYVIRPRRRRFSSHHYFTNFPLPASLAEKFEVRDPFAKGGIVYADHAVYHVGPGERGKP